MRGAGSTLGVLGGMGPAATAEFLRLIAHRFPATRDQEHPRVLLLSEPGIPDRSSCVLTGDDAPLPQIREGLSTLVSWGADLLAVPCNTAHVFIDRFRQELPAPLVDIVEATLATAVSRGAGASWLAATSGTVHGGLYQRRALDLGHRLLLPEPHVQEGVETTIRLVKMGRTEQAAACMTTVARSLWRTGPFPVIAACTELPLAYEAAGLPPDMAVSSLECLASSCVDTLLARAGRR
ncbi:aspartate/glutamate racemase family protein [Nocardiopsis quinghaiensis]|uniref:aspartate/glutamate racemase family protein n=1 Tax=Nocardiopsis quinghaiensis TaxID=464995 RepID=UPI00123A18CD|nr:amino acid racemase [Nocardiopsis quinghaiensis]